MLILQSLHKNYSIDSNDYKLTLRGIEAESRPMVVTGFKNVRDKRIDLLEKDMQSMKAMKLEMQTMKAKMYDNEIIVQQMQETIHLLGNNDIQLEQAFVE